MATETPRYDPSPAMREYDVISDIRDAMLDLGWEPYQHDQKDSSGPFGTNWPCPQRPITPWVVFCITHWRCARSAIRP